MTNPFFSCGDIFFRAPDPAIGGGVVQWRRLVLKASFVCNDSTLLCISGRHHLFSSRPVQGNLPGLDVEGRMRTFNPGSRT